MNHKHERKIAFFGGSRYSKPLDQTRKKKYMALEVLGEQFVLGFSHNLCPEKFTEIAHFYLIPKLPLPIVRYFTFFIFGLPFALWLIGRHRVRVLIAQSPYEGFAAALAKNIARWFGRKVILVVESHGNFEEDLFSQRRVLFLSLYRLLMRQVAGFSIRHADVLRAISHSTRQQLERWAPGRLIFQFPAWTDIEVFFRAGSDKKYHSSQDLLYAGVLIRRKGVQNLINAFASVAGNFPEARLIIVGGEENKTYAAEMKELVRGLGLEGRIQFMGGKTQEDLAELMRRAFLFVLPSLSEGLGRVIIEAMATGTSVVASRVGGIPDMVTNGLTGLLTEPGDEAALAERLQWMLEHPEAASEMGRNARVFAEQFFSTERYVQGYSQMIEAANAMMNE